MFTGWFPKGSLRHIVFKNTVSQLVGRAIGTFAMTAVSLLIARRYGVDGYGDFVKITTYVGFFYLFADFGLNAQYIQNKNASWQRLFGLRLVMSSLLVLAALGILSLLPGSVLQGYTPLVRFGILLLLPAIFTQATITTTNAFFQNALKYDLAAKAQNIGSIVTAAAVIICMITTSLNGPYIGVIALLMGSVTTAYFALSYLRNLHGNISPQFQFRMMITDVKKTFPLGLTLVLNLIYFHSDSVILTLTRSTTEVGIYGLAYKVFELSLVFPVFFINSMYPVLLHVQKRDTHSSTQLFWRSTRLLLASSLVIGACLWVLAPLLIFVRPDFYQSIAPLRILLFGLPIFFLSALFMWMLIVQKQQWKLLIIHGCVMVLNTILNLFFIPRYGYVAAAWITGISETITCVVSFIFVTKKL